MVDTPGRAESAAETDRSNPPNPVEDFAPPPTTTPVSRLLLLVAHDRNRRLLVDRFADRSGFDVVDGVSALEDAGPGGRTDGTENTVGDSEDGTVEDPNEGVPLDWRTAAETTNGVGTTASGPGSDAEHGTIDPLDGEAIDLVLVDVTALGTYGEWLAGRIERERPLPFPCLLLASESTVRRFFASGSGHDLRHLVDDAVTTPVDPTLLDRRVRAYLRLRRQAAELDRRHDQLSLLAQVLRHDIANAATVVTGWGETLHGEVTPEGAEALERVVRGGQRIRELVENSRDLTTLIEAGHKLDTEAMPLAPILRTEVDAIRRVHASTTRTVTVDIDAPPPSIEVIAGGMLPSVFANLLSNAVRHNDAEAVEIGVSVEVSTAEVVVRVADNGPGIPDAEKESVFEPATKRVDSPGDGLGLSLVKRLVDSYGGRVWFEDASGGGTVACVALRRVSVR
ncbi:ATP-binding protein [Salinigranum sp. GCM10025319]|uniref:ATP-binding response regulator n=1 Tax=Salinigranum sp. GCM10025319 TaxID=3252687 RepID=UPI00361CF7B3